MKMDIFKLDEKHLTKFVKTSVTLGILGIFITVGVFYYNGYINFNAIDTQRLSAFGTFVGGFIGTFFTLAATFLIWLTYSNQKKELNKTVKMAKKQNKTLKIQQFENTYFNLLKNLHVIIDNMIDLNGINKGRKYLNDLFIDLNHKINGDELFQSLKLLTSTTTDLTELEDVKSQISKHYNSVFEQNSFNLGHFFRFIHNIIKYVEEELKEDDELKMKYLSFLQAQLSNVELAFIMYNSLSEYSLDKSNNSIFKDNIDKYRILENISPDVVFHPQLSEFFKETNFFYKRV